MTKRILSKTESEAEEKARTMECEETTHVDDFRTRTKEGLALSSLRPLMVAATRRAAYAHGICTGYVLYVHITVHFLFLCNPGEMEACRNCPLSVGNGFIDRVLGDMVVRGKIACLRSTDTCHSILSVPERRKETARQ